MSKQSRESLRDSLNEEQEEKQSEWTKRRRKAEEGMEKFMDDLAILLRKHSASIHAFRTSTGHAYVALTAPMDADPSIQVDLEYGNAKDGLVKRTRGY